MSYLVTVLTQLAALDVPLTDTVAYKTAANPSGDITPQVLYLSTLPQSAPDAKLPARLLRAMLAQDTGGKGFSFVFGGVNLATVTWRIYDVLLWRKLDQGKGIASHEADLVKYVDAYTVSVLQQFQEPHSRARLMNADITIREIEFPEGSGYFYAGVDVALDIEERLPQTTAAALQVIQNLSRPLNLISADADNALTVGTDDLLYVAAGGGGLPYKFYEAMLTTAGFGQPLASVLVLHNDTGITPSWTIDVSGYFVTALGLYTDAKTTVHGKWTNSQNGIVTDVQSGRARFGIIEPNRTCWLEIRVYP